MSATPTTKPKEHGILRAAEPSKPDPVWIPKALRNLTLVNYGGDYNDPDFSARAYGYYPMVALRDVSIFGNRVKAGESFTVPGNLGIDLANFRDASFLDSDGRRQKEIDFERTQKELTAPIDWQTEAAFQPKKRLPSRFPEFQDAK